MPKRHMKFAAIEPPHIVMAYRPGVNAEPDWAPKRMPKGYEDGDWLVKDGKGVSVVSKKDFAANYRPAA